MLCFYSPFPFPEGSKLLLIRFFLYEMRLKGSLGPDHAGHVRTMTIVLTAMGNHSKVTTGR